MWTKDEIKYLIDVLGVTEVLTPAEASVADTSAARNLQLPIQVEGDLNVPLMTFFDQPLSSELKQLLDKMIKAMKLSQVLCVQWKGSGQVVEAAQLNEFFQNQIQNSSVKAGVLFGEKNLFLLSAGQLDYASNFGQFISAFGIPWMVTHGLEDLVQASENQRNLKAETWKHLQQLMEKI